MDPAAKEPFTPLAVVGMSALFPKAPSLEAYWANILGKVDAIAELPATHWRADEYFDADPKSPDRTYSRRGGFLEPVDFDPLAFGISPNNLEATDTAQLLGLYAAAQALCDAGYAPEDAAWDRSRTSVILGVTGTLELVVPLGARLGHPLWRKALKEAGVPDAQADDVVRRIADGYVPWQENSFPGLLGNVVAGRIANRFDLGGTNCVVDAACASSLSAIHLAALELASGKSDMVISGGVDTFNDIFMFMCFSKTPALSPTGNARPFDRDGDGTILGEGVGIVVLKRLADAERDGNRIYAVLRGIGTSSDGRGNAIYAPKGEGQQRCLRDAYARAQVAPETIELIEGHGTGTKVGDATELSALNEVFRNGEAAAWCAVGSVKSQIGHTKAAAGAAGLIKAAMALRHRVLPPTIKVRQPAELAKPGKSPFYLSAEARPWIPRASHPRRAGVSSFGFGGTNFHCVLEEYDRAPAQVAWDDSVLLFAYCGARKEDLRAALDELNPDAAWSEWRDAAARSRSSFDARAAWRLCLVAEKAKTDRVQLLAQARGLLDAESEQGVSPLGAYLGSGAPEGSLAFLFPGQGSQYVGMLRELACRFPAMVETLAEADAACGAEGGRLSETIYPLPAFDDETRAEHERHLRDTRRAQPALGAVSYGALRVLRETFGLDADAFAGHSFGELTALCAAGAMDARALFELARTRGELMASGEGGDRGAMLAVQAPLEQLEAILEQENLDLVLANKNAPLQGVLSGATNEIERAAQVLKARKIRAVRLPVSAAFHSRFVADAAAPFRKSLDQARLDAPAKPVVANRSAEPYPADARKARALLAEQLSHPVEFVRSIEHLYEMGARTLVEVGPGARLSGLVDAILAHRPHAALALDAANGRGNSLADLARLLAQVAARGHAVRMTAWDATHRPADPNAKKPGLTVPICGANYRKTRSEPAPAPKPAPALKHEAAPPASPRLSEPAAPANLPAAFPAGGNGLETLLRATQENMRAMVQLQEQTARLHRQFLTGQEQAQQTLQSLLRQQEHLFGLQPGTTLPPLPSLPAMPVAPTAPVPVKLDFAAPPAVPVPPVANAAPAASALERVLLEVVAEKTGYPTETIRLDMDLEADLGIDSIKRVEILSALQERVPEARAVASDELGALRTLGQIVAYAGANAPATAQTIAAHGVATQPFTAQHAAAQASAPSAAGELTPALLEIVAEKTGYPATTIRLDMDLEADLGIDSIKRVEILSAFQERFPQTRAVASDELGGLRTLGEILAHAAAQAPAAAHALPAKEPVPQIAGENLTPALLEIVAEKTGYPAATIRLDMDLEADLGIDSIKRVEILSAFQERFPQARAVASDELGGLRTLGEILAHAAAQAPAPGAPKPAAPARQAPPPAPETPVDRLVLSKVALDGFAVEQPVALPEGATIWITDDDPELARTVAAELRERRFDARVIGAAEAGQRPLPKALGGLIVLSPRKEDPAFLARSFRLIRACGPALRASSENGGAALMTVSRLDGGFGLLDLNGHSFPESAGLAGLAKTARHEWPAVHAKAVDLSPSLGDPGVAAARVAEEFLRGGPVEVGLSAAGRYTVELRAEAFGPPEPEPPLAPGEVVVVSGGARGVTPEACLALARRFRPVLVLLGRSPEPAPEPAWLSALGTEAEVKRALAERGNGSATPRAIEAEYRRIAANREIVRNLARLSEAGARAVYRSVDVRDAAAVAQVLERVRKELGPIRGLIHAAGVLADRLIEEKTDEQFDAVYGTKVEGLRNLLAALAGDELKILVLFSSFTGRHGRRGQADYAAANEVLNKVAQVEARRRRGCRVVALNWGPWDGGMVTPPLRKIFEQEGVGLIGLQAGAEYLVKELCANGTRPVEITVMARGRGAASRTTEASARETIRPADGLKPAFELDLSPERQPVLAAHVIDGRPVLPLAMIAEWLAQGALHLHPGMAFLGFDELRVLKGVVLPRDGGACRVRILAGKAQREESLTRVPMELWGAERLHARADVLLATRLPAAPPPQGEPSVQPYEHSMEHAYAEFLFHGPALQGLRAVEGSGEAGIVAVAQNAPAPSQWLAEPLRGAWVGDPLVLDCAFQMMILWSIDQRGHGCLPARIGRYRQYRRAFPNGGARLIASIAHSGEHAVRCNVGIVAGGDQIARLEDLECTVDASLSRAFRRKVLEA